MSVRSVCCARVRLWLALPGASAEVADEGDGQNSDSERTQNQSGCDRDDATAHAVRKGGRIADPGVT